MGRTPTLVQLNDELLRRLDERAAREKRSRSAVIRAALEAHLRDERVAEIDRQIVDAYTRIPQAEDPLADWQARVYIAEEPW